MGMGALALAVTVCHALVVCCVWTCGARQRCSVQRGLLCCVLSCGVIECVCAACEGPCEAWGVAQRAGGTGTALRLAGCGEQLTTWCQLGTCSKDNRCHDWAHRDVLWGCIRLVRVGKQRYVSLFALVIPG